MFFDFRWRFELSGVDCTSKFDLPLETQITRSFVLSLVLSVLEIAYEGFAI